MAGIETDAAEVTGRCYCGATTIRAHRRPATVSYCPCDNCRHATCGSAIAFRGDDLAGQVGRHLGLLDQAGELASSAHSYDSKRLPWRLIEDQAQRFPTSSRAWLNSAANVLRTGAKTNEESGA